MFSCNNLMSLSVLSLYEGELIGIVDKLYFDKKLKKLLEIEIIGENGAKLTLISKNIYKIGKNAITIKNNQAVALKVENSDLCLCPINSKAYSINGEFLGVIKEIIVNEKYMVEKISLDNDKTLEICNLATCGKNTVIFNNADKKTNIKKFTPMKEPEEFKQESEIKVEILPQTKVGKNVVSVDAVSLHADVEFLIGRKCLKDIYNFNNEILIKANSIINKKNLKEIKKFGKIRELMLFSK